MLSIFCEEFGSRLVRDLKIMMKNLSLNL